MEKKKIVYRGGGFGLYFFIALFLFLLLPLWIILSRGLSSADLIGLIVLAGLESMLLVFMYFVFFAQKIVLTKDQLISFSMVGSGTTLPQRRVSKIDLDNIQDVTIATISFFRKNSSQFHDANLQRLVEDYRSIGQALKAGPIFSSLATGKLVTGWTPLIFIRSKTGSSLAVSTKSFSKNTCRRLIADLRSQGVVVNTEERLKL